MKPYIIIIALLAATSLALLLMGDVAIDEESGIKQSLPDRVADYHGDDIRYCQNEQCGGKYLLGELSEGELCPVCGADTRVVSPEERRALPADTLIARKQYRNDFGETVAVTIVFSGKERTSIHRPQMCLVAQGHQIVEQRVMSAPIHGRAPLKIMMLDVQRPIRRDGEQNKKEFSALAYWFVSNDRETPYYLHLTWWTAADNVFRGKSQRWAYVAIATDRIEGADSHAKRLADFIAALCPLIRPTQISTLPLQTTPPRKSAE